jgi:hypothetical protein
MTFTQRACCSTWLILGALLAAAPLARPDPVIENGVLQWFRLTETREEVTRVLGSPRMVTQLGDDFESWQYQIGVTDEHEYSHQLVFRRSTGRLVSATRTFEQDRDIDWLFTDGRDSIYWLTNPDGSKYGVRVSRQPDDCILLVPGSTGNGKPSSQIVLLRAAELPLFYPWLQLRPEFANSQRK